MTALTYAARNLLAQDTELTALLGRSLNWPTWIFADKPFVKIENSQRVLIVITQGDPWAPPNPHNTQTFPLLNVDVWADPTRNADKSVKEYDADDKIEAVVKHLNKHFHTVNVGVPYDAPAYLGTRGMPRIWGTAEQIAEKTGVVVTGSQRLDGPSLSDMRESEGTRMGRMQYGVNVA